MKSSYPIIIAEVGVNHNGNINVAKKLINIAKKAGCDFVKFQSFKPENGQNLSEELDKIVEEKIVDKEKDEELKENLNEIFKSVLEEETDEFRAI